jgi:hypothetical protein
MRRWAIVALAVATALMHLSFFIRDPKGGVFSVLFLLNGLGYLGLLGLLYVRLGLPQSLVRLVRPAFIAYTALTIILYVVFSYQAGNWSIPLGPIDKLAELALIGLLWSEGRSASAMAG